MLKHLYIYILKSDQIQAKHFLINNYNYFVIPAKAGIQS